MKIRKVDENLSTRCKAQANYSLFTLEAEVHSVELIALSLCWYAFV